MTWSEGERLYNLLPAVHRIRDVEAGEPLRTLLSIIEAELEVIEADIENLYDNWFIETCAPWVVPYIGDLVGSTMLSEAVRPRRADAAKTIHYRRRKATVAMLTELSEDVTGWDAHVVEFMRLLLWNQHVNHRRLLVSPNPTLGDGGVVPVPISPGTAATPHRARLTPPSFTSVGNVHLRDLDAADRVHGPFDACSHNIDVRPAGPERDRYRVRTLGFFLWRLQSYPLTSVNAAPSPSATDGGTAWGYHINPLGAPAALFLLPEPTPDGEASTEMQVAGPIRPLAIHSDLERARAQAVRGAPPASAYVGSGLSVHLARDGAVIPPDAIVVMHLETWHRPPSEVRYRTEEGAEVALEVEAGLDVERGRVVFPVGREPEAELLATLTYGFSADLGGGPYSREAGGVSDAAGTPGWSMTVRRQPTPEGEDPADFTELSDALAARAAAPAEDRANVVITILDNATYEIDAQGVELAADESLTVQARDESRPAIRVVEGGAGGAAWAISGVGDEESEESISLVGLLIEGGLEIAGPVDRLTISHCTLAPGRRLDELGEPAEASLASVLVDPGNDRIEISIDHCIAGALELPEHIGGLTVRDSIIDALDDGAYAIAADRAGAAPGPDTTLERVTILGSLYVRRLALASEVIATGRWRALRRQDGCVRFSYVRPGSITPRRYRCQPDIAVALALDAACPSKAAEARAATEGRVRPDFTARRYGHPAYAQLSGRCPTEITRGAEDESEMGAFCMLKQPQREANLRTRLGEYLPFGLEPAVICVT